MYVCNIFIYFYLIFLPIGILTIEFFVFFEFLAWWLFVAVCWQPRAVAVSLLAVTVWQFAATARQLAVDTPNQG